MTGARIAAPLTVAVALAIAALTLAPRAFEAGFLLSSRDDPVALADHAVARSFDATVAAREIEGALAANDPDLANSFLDLARDRNVPVDAALAAKVDTANAGAASAARSVESFARGLITGEPDDLSGLAGTALGDLFVFGDIRDAVREGTRFATGQQADELILGLACVGLAITAGTYASLGAAAPARVGMTVVKAARKTGRIGGQMGAWISRSVREVIDWTSLRSAIKGASMTQPAAAVRAAREAVKVEKARDLVRLVGDVGRVQSRAGTQAALDGMKLAQGPRDMSKIARLAATKGGKTRAILKLAGRSAIVTDGGRVQSRELDAVGDRHGLRLGVGAQTDDRTRHRTLLRPPQAAPGTPTAGARAGGTARARTRSARAEDGRTDRHCFPGAGLGACAGAGVDAETRLHSSRAVGERGHPVSTCRQRRRQDAIGLPAASHHNRGNPAFARSERHAALCPRRRRHRVSR